jgi:hypothetical protein
MKKFWSLRHANLLALLPLCGLLGCQSIGIDTDRFARFFGGGADPRTLPEIIEPRVFLGGEALAQKKKRIRRVHADLVHLLEGYQRVERQLKSDDQRQLEGFIRPYIEKQATPLVATGDQPWNPDLRLLEANLLFAAGALFGAIGDDDELADVANTIEDRFVGYESLLVEYPIGETQTLAGAVADLRGAGAAL